MISLLETLRGSEDPQKIAHDLISYFQNAFKSSEAISEEQTYAYIDRVVKNISKNPHPNQLIFSNVINRLKFMIKQTIKIFEEDLSSKKRTVNSEKTLVALFENLAIEDKQVKPADETDDSRWVKKVTLDSLNEFKEEIKNYPDELLNNLRSHIKQNSVIALFQPPSSIIQAFETLNKQIPFDCTIVSQSTNILESKVFKVIPIHKSSGLIKRANKIFLCSNTILKNGGAICLSGSLLVALTAHHLSNSVICLCPSLTLSNQLTLSQNACSELDNPSGYFKQNQQQSPEWTIITKKYDYIPPEHIAMIITDTGISTSSYAYKLIDKYYE